jgi:hypothetical protein
MKLCAPWATYSYHVSARRAIIIVVLMIARDVAHVAQACTPTREFNRAPARARQRGSGRRALPFYRALVLYLSMTSRYQMRE